MAARGEAEVQDAAVTRAEAEVQDAKAEVQDAKAAVARAEALAARDPAYLAMYATAQESYRSAQKSYRSAVARAEALAARDPAYLPMHVETLRSAMMGLQSQAQVPGSVPTGVLPIGSRSRSDPTFSIIARYELKDLTPLEALREWVVKKPDGLSFPIGSHYFEVFKPGNSEIGLFELEHDGIRCDELSSYLRPFYIVPPTGHTELSFVHLWASLISDTLCLFCLRSVVIDRDTNLDSNTTSKRPDVLLFVDNVPVARGEEERPGVSTFIPLQELKNKTEWVYGGVPYLLAYSAVGGNVSFVALHQDNPSSGVLTKHLVTLDLFLLRDRVRLLVVLFNIARLFPLLSRLCTEYDVEPDYLPVATWSGDKVVQVMPRNVVKTYKVHDVYCRVFNIYKAIKDVPRVEQCITSKTSHKRNRCSEHSLTFWPRVSTQIRARPLTALVQIAETLKDLHDRGWVHRDVHWRNIGSFGGSWYLIDFDEAGQVPCRKPHLLCQDAHAPEMGSGEHGFPVDVWSIGHLLATCKVQLDSTLIQLRDQCLADDPSSRPTMGQVLGRLRKISELQSVVAKSKSEVVP